MPDNPAELAPKGHFGLLGLCQRAELSGARLTIESKPGSGTRVAMVLDQA